MGEEHKEYAPDNTGPDGSYLVGKGRPPEDTKFRKDDGRKRGRRKKGTRNFATDFNEEMEAAVILTINGKPKKVTRQRSIIMRVADNASRGVPSAVKAVFDIRQKLGDPAQKISTSDEAEGRTPDLSLLDEHEFEVLGRLLAKASGQEFEGDKPAIPDGPLAYLHLPPSIDRSYTSSTVEGVVTLHYRAKGDPFEILSVGKKAYWSAALPRTERRDRNWDPFLMDVADGDI